MLFSATFVQDQQTFWVKITTAALSVSEAAEETGDNAEGGDTTEGGDNTEGGENAEGGDNTEGGENAEGGENTNDTTTMKTGGSSSYQPFGKILFQFSSVVSIIFHLNYFFRVHAEYSLPFYM